MLIVKPLEADLETNMTITTNRRLYTVVLKSTEHTYMPLVGWLYPQDAARELIDQAAAAKKVEDQAEALTVAPEQLNFNCTVSGSQVPWRPLRVYDDGSKTYLQMSPEMQSTEAPAIFVMEAKTPHPGQLPGQALDLHRRSAVRQGAASRGPEDRGRYRLRPSARESVGGFVLEHATDPPSDVPPEGGRSPSTSRSTLPEPLPATPRHPSVKRFNRKMIAGIAVVAGSVITLAFWVGLNQPKAKPAEALEAAPKPPLPNAAIEFPPGQLRGTPIG